MTKIFVAGVALALSALGALAYTDGSDVERLAEKTETWVANWRVTPQVPTDFETLRRLYSDETYTSFDFGPPAEGFKSFAPAWQYYQTLMTNSPVTHWRLELLEEPTVELRGDVAWSTSTVSLDGRLQNGTEIDVPVARVTLIFEREAEDWKIVHEHGSAPLPLE